MYEYKIKILIVGNVEGALSVLNNMLGKTSYQALQVNDAAEALAQLSIDAPALVISDLQLPDMDGLQLFDAIQHSYPLLPVMLYAAHGTVREAIAAIRKGVTEFFTKPLDQSLLLDTIQKVIDENPYNRLAKNKENAWREGIFTRSSQMENLIKQAKLLAASDASVLIQGESGTGKELLAHAIHQASPRKSGPFVAINCGAMPESLLESELFGHAKGAFTGAISDHKGLFQSAEGGTILLDEIGDMPLLLQVKLLRVLQERVVRPVGSNTNIPINVRVISATHRNLTEEMKAKRFREDLYYRINVVSLPIPSLAERKEDIALIANNLLQAICQRYNKKLNGFSPEAMRLLIAAPWPGNVRQLQNIVEHAVVLATTPIVPASLVQSALQDNITPMMPFEIARKGFERQYLINLLKITQGNVAQAAEFAQRHRTEFYKLLERHELSPAMFKKEMTNS